MLIGPGLLEGIMASTKYCDPSNWTLVQEWDGNIGDIATIDADLGGGIDLSGFAWSPDGTKLTISSGGSNVVITYSCSTAWDPETATKLATRGPAGNPNCMSFILGGGAFFILYSVGDDIHRFSASNYIVSEASSEHSICTKGEVGLSGTTDGPFCTSPDGGWVYWLGADASQDPRLKYVTFTNADLDQDSVGATSGILTGELATFSAEQKMSPPNTDGDKFFYVNAGYGTLVTLDNGLGDLSSITQGTRVNLNSLIGSWSAELCWIDPTNTAFVWVGGWSNNSLQLAKFRQNCP